MILCGELADFIDVLAYQRNEEAAWEYYLAKIFDKSFNSFRESLLQSTQLPEINLKATIGDSAKILDGFIPTERA